MRGALVIVQILISFAVVAVTMPIALAWVPATRDATIGPASAAGLALVVFVILRIGWPRRAR